MTNERSILISSIGRVSIGDRGGNIEMARTWSVKFAAR
jgi:hypothetical protein